MDKREKEKKTLKIQGRERQKWKNIKQDISQRDRSGSKVAKMKEKRQEFKDYRKQETRS